MKILMKVNTRWTGLHKRTGPGMGYRILGLLAKGSTVMCDNYKSGWYHHSGGWSYGGYLKVIKDYGATNPSKPATPAKPKVSKEEMDALRGLITDLDYDMSSLDQMQYVYGMPHQFTAHSDPRPDKSEYGRMFMSTIVEDLPLVILTPGKADFLKGFSKNARSEFKSMISGAVRGNDAESMSEVLAGEKFGRYYNFKSDYEEYIKYVNNMCRLSAMYMGIGDVKPLGMSANYKNFNWHAYNGSLSNKKRGLFTFLSQEPSVAFYMDSKQSSFGESSSNSTGSSVIEGALSKGGDAIKEFRFLFNNAVDDSAIVNTSKANYEQAVKKIFDKIKLKNIDFASQMTDYGTTIINGANIAMADVWKDSNYGKSYSIEIKLVSPYGDKKSIYYNILVPLFHLVALAFPRQLGRAGYMHPFLVRCFSKGWFNCSMGIVESISIKKGSQDGWSIDGLPTDIDVSLSIKDLYESIGISRDTDSSTFANTEFLDFLATTSGVNINKSDFGRKIGMYYMWSKNRVTKVPQSVYNSMVEAIGNNLRNYLK